MKWRTDNSALILISTLFIHTACFQTLPETPEHLEIVVTSSELTDLRPHFQKWEDSEALYCPQSTIIIHHAGEHRDESRVIFSEAVPETWGANAIAGKRAFREKCLAVLKDPGGLPPLERSPRQPLTGSITLISPGMTFDLIPDYPQHTAVVLDLSGGVNADAAREFVLNAYGHWLKRCALGDQSTFLVIITGKNRASARVVFQLTIPSGNTPGERFAFVLGGREELRQLHLQSPRDSSAIIEAVNLSITLLSENAPSTDQHLFLLSDLKQITKNRLAFQVAVPSAQKFQDWLQSESLWMDLSNTRVYIAGLKHQNQTGDQFTSKHDLAIRGIWSTTITAMGSPEVRMVTDPHTLFVQLQGGKHVK